jgi:hypothetical protein
MTANIYKKCSKIKPILSVDFKNYLAQLYLGTIYIRNLFYMKRNIRDGRAFNSYFKGTACSFYR